MLHETSCVDFGQVLPQVNNNRDIDKGGVEDAEPKRDVKLNVSPCHSYEVCIVCGAGQACLDPARVATADWAIMAGDVRS